MEGHEIRECVSSPQPFNITIDDLLSDIYTMSNKLSIGYYSCNVFAYAYTITVMCTTVPGLQRLIDRCVKHTLKWMFKFGIRNIKCLVISGNCLNVDPLSYLYGKQIENVKSLEIFGVIFEDDSSGSQTGSMDKRTDMKCGRSLYGLRDMGMSYPGMSSDVKAYI